jgi:hypothetical protein
MAGPHGDLMDGRKSSVEIGGGEIFKAQEDERDVNGIHGLLAGTLVEVE